MATNRATICHVLHSLRVGGAEMLAARLARQLRQAFQFVFACLDELGQLGQDLRDDGFVVQVLDRRSGLDWKCAWRLGRFLRRERVSLVHAHQYTPFFYSMTARLLYRRPPLLFTEHGRHHPDYPRRKRILANRLLLERRDRVLGVGEAVRHALITNEGLPAHRVAVLYNGIDLTTCGNGVDLRAAVRQEIGIGPDDFLMLLVARLDYLKDHKTAIRTLAEVIRRYPSVRLVLVGDGPCRAAIEDQVGQQGLAPYVRFLGLRKDVARLLRAADLFLLTSISEGIPLTVIEAMAAGLPGVATRVGGLAEVVEHGQTGLLADPCNPAALAERICSLVENAPLRRQMGRLGRQRAEALFSEERMHARYQLLYQEMLLA